MKNPIIDGWYATNREICDYVTAASSIKEFLIINNTGFDLFIEKVGKNIIWRTADEKIILKGH